MQAVLRVLSVILLVASGVGAQTVVEDPEGDVKIISYDQEAPLPAGYSALDLLELRLDEDPQAFYLTLQVAGYEQDPAANYRNGDMRTVLQHGEIRYVVQMGRDLTGDFYGLLSMARANDYDLFYLADLETEGDAEEGTVTVTIPRMLLVNQNGERPRGGQALSDIYTDAFSQYSLGGPDPSDPFSGGADLLVMTDRMPDTGGNLHEVIFGGSRGEGLTVGSIAPYRASNGGQPALAFAPWVQSPEGGEATVTLVDVPAEWTVEAPDVIQTKAGETTLFDIVVYPPPRHQHGGTQNFTLRIDQGDSWGELDMGIHYLTVPQPAGHHDTLFFHVRDTFSVLDPISQPLGYADGASYMNTLSLDSADTGNPVDSTRSQPGGLASQWDICLSPELLLGLDWNRTRTGEVSATWTATRPYGEATLSGQLLHFGHGPSAPCNADAYREAGRPETLVAQLGETEPQELEEATFVAPVHALVDRVPYQKGANLMLVLRLDYTVPDSQMPGPAQLLPGGSIQLPLNEYFEGLPETVGNGVTLPAVPSTVEPVELESTKDTPAVAPVLVLGLLGVAGWVARRP